MERLTSWQGPEIPLLVLLYKSTNVVREGKFSLYEVNMIMTNFKKYIPASLSTPH